MRKLKLFFAFMLMAVLSIGQMWAVEELKATIDFSSNDFSIPTSKTVAENTYTHDGISMTLKGTSGNGYAYYSKDKYLLNGKQGATITFSAFEWKTTKIVVTGRSGASGSTKMNIFVGENAVSTETTGSTGTNTYNIASTSQAAGTIYTLKVTSAHNAQFTKFEIYGEDAGTPAKTLTSIAVSGTPTKTSYYAGDNFDPAGLTVTGTYSDESTAPITSGITWSYDPSQELALNQTSIGVTATVSNIESAEYPVSITVAAAPAAVEYAKFNGDIEEGDYVIYYGGKAMKNTVASNRLYYDEVTPENDKILNPSEAIVWHIAPAATAGYWTMYNEAVSKYAVCTNSNNQANLNASAEKALVSVVEVSEGNYNILSKIRQDAGSNNYYLRENTTYGFAFYSASTGGLLTLYKKVDSSEKPSAELSYADVDKKKLVKYGDAFTVPTLVNPHTVAVTYASSDANIVAVNETTGAVTINATGVAIITASFAGNDDYKAGSAFYTIGVTSHAGTGVDPYVAADAKIVIDAADTKENAYVSGIVSSIYTTSSTFDPEAGNISFYFSADGTTTGQQIEAYKCFGLNSAKFAALTDVETGATVVIKGTLKKYNSTYELDQNCYLISYEAPAAPKQSIANTKETAYTVAQALVYAADGITYDLDDYVYVQGVVYDVKSFNNGAMNIFIKDANTENQFELYKCAGINDGNVTTPFDALTDVQAGNIVIGYGQLTVYNTTYEFKQGNYLVDLQKPVTGVQLDQTEASVEEEATVTLTATILPSNATGTIVWSVESGSDKASVENGVVTGIAEGEATIRATVQGTEIFAECTVTVTEKSAPDTRKVANSPAEFEAVSGDMTPADITFASYKGGAGTDPFITSGKAIRLYQISGSNAFGGYITLSAVAGCTIDEVQITTTSSYSTTVAYSKDGNENLLGSENVAASSSYTTGTGLNVSSVNILNMGTGSSGRLEIASIKVYYTGEAATIDHYELGGTYATEFEVGDDFNHNGLIVYAAYDALGENKVDITSACTFSTPDMSTEGQKTIDITYKEEVVKNYTITVNASTDTRKVAESPATFTAVSGDMVPADITFASYKGGAGNDPYLAATGIRLYQISGSNDFGGFITLTAKKGCTIDQVKITTTNSYATTVAYSVDGNENLLGSESVAKSSDYSTPSGLNVESVNIVNKGTGSSGRLEIASIKVWYTGDALAVDHYILGGTYETVFEQFGTFSYEGLTVTAAYDELETITEAVTGFTVEADLSTAGAKKAEIMLNSVKIAEYDITVTESPKEDPALAYDPNSVILTFGQSLSAPTFINTHNVSPISYNSDKPAVATVDAEGNISLAGGIGVAVITASFAGDDNYIESEATFTITVNEPAEDLSGTWIKATSIAAGDRIIIGATVSAETKTMGKQNSNNRAAVASYFNEFGELIPGEGTKTFLVVDAGDSKFALQALNGKYLTSATSGTGNNLLEAANYENDNAKWTITIDGEGVASVVAAAGSRTYMKYNNGSTLFSCYQYATSQSPINIYKQGTLASSEVRTGLTAGNYYTICYPKAMKDIQGATLWSFIGKDANMAYIQQETAATIEAGKPYLLYAEAETVTAIIGKDDAASAGSNGALHGTFEKMYQANLDDAGDNIYLIIGNELRRATGLGQTGNTLPANRAYVNLDEIGSAPALMPAHVRSMPLHKDTATGLENAEASKAPVKMIIDGQLYILRGEKMYNANGQLVK